MKTLATPALLVVSWLLWSGHFDPLMLVFGFASCAFVYYLLLRLEAVNNDSSTLRLLAKIPLYLPWLFWQVLLSNLAVAKTLWSPNMRLKPAVQQVKATQKSNLGLVVYANSVTLTPGTLSVDAQQGSVLVHALNADDFDGEGFKDMDERVSALED